MKHPSDQYDPDRYRKPDARTRDEVAEIISNTRILSEAATIAKRGAARGWIRFPAEVHRTAPDVPPTPPDPKRIPKATVEAVRAELAIGSSTLREIAKRHGVSPAWVCMLRNGTLERAA